MKKIAAILAIVVGMSGQGAWAGDTYDLLFKEGTLGDIAVGDALTYAQETTAPQRDPALPATQSFVLSLDVADDGRAVLKRTTGASSEKTIGSFDATVGNPLAMYFLEHTVANVARATGGSPFYIRNRMKEALLRENSVAAVEAQFGGAPVSAREILILPFEGDRNAARFGVFANLELRVVVADAVPGWYLSLTAETPAESGNPIYSDTVLLEAN